MSYYITIKSFQLDPRYIDAPAIDLGDGVDLEDPTHPAKSTYSVFKPKREGVGGRKESKMEAIKSKSIINESMVIKESRG
jgi:hypothetical protein